MQFARVETVADLAEGIRGFRLASGQDMREQVLSAGAGAHVDVALENAVIRQYSTFDASDDGGFSIAVKRIRVEPEPSILAAPRTGNFRCPASCEGGGCGAGLPAGDAIRNDAILSDFEKAEQKDICLSVSRSAGGMLTLDLQQAGDRDEG